MRIVQGTRHARGARIPRGLDVRGAAREEDAVDARQDLGDVERRLEHGNQQRQAIRGLHHRGDVLLADGMERMRSDHASI
jgi:hypothetical protein